MNNSGSAIFSGTEKLLKLLSGENLDKFNFYDEIIYILSLVLLEYLEKVFLYYYIREEFCEFFFYVKVGEKFIQYIELEKMLNISK